MNFLQFLNSNIVYLDGGMGTLLQERGLKAGECPERWNVTHSDVIKSVHKAYFDAGSNLVCSNTFGANALKFNDDELDEIIKHAFINAKNAAAESVGNQRKFIALDVGPLGKLLKPFGDLDFEDAVKIFAKTVKLGVKYGADAIFIETMNDGYETKAALLAAKENSDLPVLVSNAYDEDGKLMTGASPSAMVALAEGMGAAAVGANCSLGPKQLVKVIEELIKTSSIPVILKPNAGLPRIENEKTVFDVDENEFAEEISKLIKKGARLVGGCCGTTPKYIQTLVKATENLLPVAITKKDATVVTSNSRVVEFGKRPVLIGERINPTGKKRFKQALIENDIDYILNEGARQEEKGAHLLDVNVGLPEINEVETLKTVVDELQAVVNVPLQIDTSSAQAMEAALRRYNGKALVNSVNGKEESMQAVFPIVKKYGGVLIALTLDENGIPETSDERVEIARKILKRASEYGIVKKNIIFDTLAMTVSADANAAKVTLESLKRIKTELGCNTSLGVSNVSFGLPNRDAINSIFFALALENGLSAAIMNPFSADMLKTYYAYNALNGLDDNFSEYISNSSAFTTVAVDKTVVLSGDSNVYASELQRCIVKGMKEKAGTLTKELLKTTEALSVVNNEIIPALDIVGKGFEQKTVYLPQLLMSAEAAKVAFEQIKISMSASSDNNAKKATFVIATVHGDVHDIGKNIVKLLLENYAYNVVDLGKDVKPEVIAEAAIKYSASFVGLSALMTTTVPAMEDTIKLLREKVPQCKIIVGGAVLTKDYADKIGADKYAKDAMETIRYVESVTLNK